MSAKMLVVDDTPDLLEIHAIILTKDGFEVATTDASVDIVDMVDTFSPDLMLLDVKLKEMDGRDLCKKIKEKFNKTIPVILISPNPALLKEHKECLVMDIIEKPSDIKTIAERVKIALSKSINPYAAPNAI